MILNRISHIFILLILAILRINNSYAQNTMEKFRPTFHFTPQSGWMNDPNGMIYIDGVYHLFYQFNPDSTVWGPMHWGHATSKDLLNWKHLPIALYPDSLGTIFSGSAVIDSNNTAGFGKDALVAIFTQHNHQLENEHSDVFQNQSIAYSLDKGMTWTKYKGNPILKNPGIRDFRDPKVFWYAPDKKWIMTLATLDHITFYSSNDLKQWTEESQFGLNIGAHGGVWECPDLFPLQYKGESVWVLIVNLNPGGPNGGSATQYFTGTFDGHKFISNDSSEKWIDYGPDEYAGVNWANTKNRTIFLGWMSNWEYAQQVPTKSWRSAMTIPRELSLEKVKGEYLVASKPVRELTPYLKKEKSKSKLKIKQNIDITKLLGKVNGVFDLKLNGLSCEDFTIQLHNSLKDTLVIGYSKVQNMFFIDRTKSGVVDFNEKFSAVHYAPRFIKQDQLNLRIVGDNTSVELFADNGLTTMTSIFFPHEPMSNLMLSMASGNIDKIELKK